MLRNAVGLDPEAKGFASAFVKAREEKVKIKNFLSGQEDLGRFISWVKKQGDVIIGIEGSNGQSKPIENALRAEGIVFYSFKPADVCRFRKAVLGQNKNNARDAESVARYAMALENQGKLERCRRVFVPDEELRMLTRGYEQKSKAKTMEVNRLWKIIRVASVDLYLTLAGKHPDNEVRENIIQKQGILQLLSEKPDLLEWKGLSEEELLGAMGNRNYQGRMELIKELKKITKTFEPQSDALTYLIKGSADQVLSLSRQMREIGKLLDTITREDQAVQLLRANKGISTIIASTLKAEIIDIRRFATNNNLASYSGLCRKEHSTGERSGEAANSVYNRRLKDAFMTAAKNFVRFNPESHLSGYCRNLIKGGMKVTEAYKRTARALVRTVFHGLSSLDQAEREDEGADEMKMRESDMASGNNNRSDNNHPSNISSFSLAHNKGQSQKESSDSIAGEKVDLSVGKERLPLSGSKGHRLSGELDTNHLPADREIPEGRKELLELLERIEKKIVMHYPRKPPRR